MGRAVGNEIGEYFVSHRNIEIPIRELCDELAMSEAQIKSAIATARASDKPWARSLVPVVDGRVWVYTTAQAPEPTSKSIYEELATTPQGVALVTDEEGNIFKLTAIGV